MKKNLLRLAAAVGVASLIASLSPLSAFAASTPAFDNTTDGPVYLVNGTTVADIAEGTQLDWDYAPGIILASKPKAEVTSSNQEMRFPAPTGGASTYIAFIAPVGSERTKSAWMSWGDSSAIGTGAYLPSVWPGYLGNGTPATVKATGGTYSMGIAYLKDGGLTVVSAYYTTINVDAGTGTWTFSAPVISPTTTTLAASESSVNVGSPVTLTANVTAGVSGTVQFYDGTTALGTPVTVASGVATKEIAAISAGSHSYTAKFTPVGLYSASTSGAVSVAGVKNSTSIDLAASASSIVTGSTVTLTATVTPATAAGNVQLLDGTSVILTTQGVGGGINTVTWTDLPSEGSHSYTARFVENDTYSTSTSAAVDVDSVAPAFPNAPTESGLVDSNKNSASAVLAANGTLTVTVPTSLNGQTFNAFIYSSTPVWGGEVTPASGQFTLDVGALPAGSHKIAIANLTDSNVVAWATFEKTTAGDSFSKTINATTVAVTPTDGEFSLVSANTDAVNLDNPTFVNGASVSSGALGEFTVTDQRKVSMPGWSLQTNVDTFTKGTDEIAASALGIKPELVSQVGTGATDPTLGAEQVSGSASYPWNFATLAAGKFSGVSTYDADLTFTAPAGSAAGTYTSTITLTLVSQ